MPPRNLAPRTRSEYAHDIEDLIALLGQNDVHNAGQVSRNHLEHYLAELDRRGQTGTTRRRKASSIKSFLDFLRSTNIIQNNLAESLTLPRRENRQPRVLSEQEYKRLLRACGHETRDAAIIELLLQTGIRLSELADLTFDDIELPARINRDPANIGTLRIGSGKGRKDRTIALNFKVCKALEAYLAVRSNVEHNAVFITNQVRPADGAQRIPGVGEEVPWRGRDQRRLRTHTQAYVWDTPCGQGYQPADGAGGSGARRLENDFDLCVAGARGDEQGYAGACTLGSSADRYDTYQAQPAAMAERAPMLPALMDRG